LGFDLGLGFVFLNLGLVVSRWFDFDLLLLLLLNSRSLVVGFFIILISVSITGTRRLFRVGFFRFLGAESFTTWTAMSSLDSVFVLDTELIEVKGIAVK